LVKSTNCVIFKIILLHRHFYIQSLQYLVIQHSQFTLFH